MIQVALVSDEHDDDVRVCVITNLLQPPHHVDVRRIFCNIVYQQSSDGTTVAPAEKNTSLAKIVREDCGERWHTRI
jgi:hypothetical protein